LAAEIEIHPLPFSFTGDAAAYYVGKKFGSKKVTMVSPSKSWEGVYAEIGFSFFAGLAFKFLETQPWVRNARLIASIMLHDHNTNTLS
jgi:CDP-diglyceride synthetase